MAPKQKVLIVEDNPDLRRLYAIGLNQAGFEVRLAANGAEALDRIEGDRPDLILLDILMPVMDGWELIEKVNDPQQGQPQTPVVVVTGQASPSDHSVHPSVVGWLSKPVTIEEVVQTIHQTLPPPSAAAASLFPPDGDSGSKRETTASD